MKLERRVQVSRRAYAIEYADGLKGSQARTVEREARSDGPPGRVRLNEMNTDTGAREAQGERHAAWPAADDENLAQGLACPSFYFPY